MELGTKPQSAATTTMRTRWLRRFVAHLPLLLAGVGVLLWPALFNGQPFFFPDTSAYIRGADAGVERLTGLSTAWSRPENRVAPGAAPAGDAENSAAPTSLSSIQSQTVLSGRSVYYGALLYAGYVTSAFWLTAAVQAALVAVALILVLRACGLTAWPFRSMALLVAALTPASWFASLLMPDVFAGLAILACAMLIVGRREGRHAERAFWALLLAYALLCHQSHIVLTAVLFGCGVVWRVMAGHQKASATGLLLIFGALVASFLGETTFRAGVSHLVGAPPVRPPFLMARLIADGPGYEYLRDTCPNNGFVVCRFLDRLPLYAGPFLWDPERGVFAATDPDTRRALSREEYDFVLAVLTHDPLAQVRASVVNVVWQVTALQADSLTYEGGTIEGFERSIPSEYLSGMRRSAAYLGTMPVGVLTLLSRLSTFVGLIYLTIVLAASRLKRHALVGCSLAGFVIVGVLMNAAICGALSAPAPRYQTRVAWLLPVLALIVDFSRREQWWRRAFRME